MLAAPILFVLLVAIFGNLVAGFLPILIGGIAVLGAFTMVRVITIFTDVSILTINVISILGLGLAIDYGLFIVGRFREELDRGHEVPVALSRTMASAGRTVAVSGFLITLALSSLLMFPQILLRSMGLGGSATVLVSMVTSLTVLPAILAVLGRRIDALRLPWGRRRTVPTLTGAIAASGAPATDSTATGSTAAGSTATGSTAADRGRWSQIAGSVMRRPVLYAVGVTAVLLLLATPFLHVRFGGIDERMLPEGTESRVVSERLATEFKDGGLRPIRVLITNASSAAAADFTRGVEAVPDVRDTVVAAQQDTSTLLTVNFDGPADSVEARTIAERIRALDPPRGAQIMVGGTSAAVVDQLDSIGRRLPMMALTVAAITFVLLAVAFGSVVVPLKAIVMNLVSIGAAFGAVTWIFQDGHLAKYLDFTPTGHVEASQPVLMIAILFGLSMDYEVFLISRIRERWDAIGDNTEAVTSGVQRTGGIITAAAVLLCVVVGAFATSGLTFIKMIGVGMIVALLVDATLVRLLLVPATMRLLGRYNWWAPAFLQRLYGRYGFRESDLDDPDPVYPGKAAPAAVRIPMT
jgi:RND superfamily putative drug exporter